MRLFLNKKIVTYILKISVGAGLYIYLLSENKINLDFLDRKNSFLLIQLFTLQIAILFIGALRWHRIGMKAYNMRISFPDTVHISWISQFFSTFTPSAVGTDVSRIFYVSKKTTMAKKDLVKVSLADRASSLFTLIICSAMGLIFYLGNFTLPISILLIAFILILLKGIPKKRLSHILLKKGFHLPPFSAVVLSLINVTLKAFSIFLVIYLTTGEGSISDYYLCLASQLIEGLAILPANIGTGHVLFDGALSFIERINGAQIYNTYFTVKVLFKMTGFAGWFFMRVR